MLSDTDDRLLQEELEEVGAFLLVVPTEGEARAESVGTFVKQRGAGA